jgi:hypothetical protein
VRDQCDEHLSARADPSLHLWSCEHRDSNPKRKRKQSCSERSLCRSALLPTLHFPACSQTRMASMHFTHYVDHVQSSLHTLVFVFSSFFPSFSVADRRADGRRLREGQLESALRAVSSASVADIADILRECQLHLPVPPRACCKHSTLRLNPPPPPHTHTQTHTADIVFFVVVYRADQCVQESALQALCTLPPLPCPYPCALICTILEKFTDHLLTHFTSHTHVQTYGRGAGVTNDPIILESMGPEVMMESALPPSEWNRKSKIARTVC